jgi:hypothetical protein
MGLFRKRRGTDAATLSPEGRWTLAQGERGGQPLILRFNEEAELAGKASWPVRTGVAVRFQHAQPNGLPGPEDMGSLEQIEDAIDAGLAEDRGVLAFVVTTGGMREFVSYVADDTVAAALQETARASAADRQVQGYAEPDPDWSAYDEFRPRKG